MINLWNEKVTINDIARDLYNVVPRLHSMANRLELVSRGGRRAGKLPPLVVIHQGIHSLQKIKEN
jgi:hypothetical protein